MAIKNAIQSSVFLKKLNYIKPTFASEEQVSLVQTHSYIERIKNLSAKKSLIYIDLDTVVSEKTYEF